MSTLVLDTVLPATAPAAFSAAGGRQGDQVAAAIRSALAATDPTTRAIERRREARQPYPYPLHLTPLDDSGRPEIYRTLVVIGRHLASQGIDFYSRLPLAERRVIASLDCGREGWTGLLLELNWCRFSRHGWYENGGRFLSVVPSPLLELGKQPRVA